MKRKRVKETKRNERERERKKKNVKEKKTKSLINIIIKNNKIMTSIRLDWIGSDWIWFEKTMNKIWLIISKMEEKKRRKNYIKGSGKEKERSEKEEDNCTISIKF